jgi:pimeloyl-ACP methyl ester carboxylesterase
MMSMWTNIQLGSGVNGFSAGQGTVIVLLPGWPQTAEAYKNIVPLLAKQYKVIALDPPGLGDSEPSNVGYDTATISKSLEHAVRPQLKGKYHLVGHDIGAWIAYAWAAQFGDTLLSLTLLDAALPGLATSKTFPLPYDANIKLWQFSFNTLPDLPEQLTDGRERQLLDWLFDRKSKHPERISREAREHYIWSYSKPNGMSDGFAYYRAAAKSGEQNVAFSKTKLQVPVMGLGGEIGTGDQVRQALHALADDVHGGVIEDCGHYLMEEQPEETVRQLLTFLAYAEEKSK